MTKIVTPHGRYNTGADAPEGKKAEVLSVSDGERMVEELNDYDPDEIKWSCRRPPEAQETEGPEVAELGATDERPLELSNAPDTMHVDPDSEAAELWLTEVEREKLRQQDNPERVEELEKSDEEFWGDIREEAEELEERALAEERQKSMERAVEGRDWMKPDHMTKKVSEMTGEEFAKVLNGDTPENVEEELAEQIREMEEPEEENADSSEVDPEVAEMAAAGFEEHAKDGGKSYWNDIAEDIRAEELGDVDSVRFDQFEDTDIVIKESGDDKLAEFDTRDEELMSEIRAVAEETDAKIFKDTGDRMLAEVSRSDVERFNS